MDRSYLSDAGVITAARSFVCIRLSTFESFSENQVLKRLFVGGSGQVENTTFAILSPDGNTHLVEPGRSPDWAFRNPQHMAGVLQDIARYYHSDGNTVGWALPLVPTLRLAINVASCDNLPLVVAPDAALLAPLAWAPELRGRAIYTVSDKWGPGIAVIQPDEFGLNGQLLSRLPATATAAQLQAALKAYRPFHKDEHDHMREGNRRGIHWQTAIPSTDPHERR